jgi:hypothetical protein
MEDFKIYIFVISLVYNLHIEKKCGICFFFQIQSFRCFVDNFDVLSTKEQLIDESLGEAFFGGPQNPQPIFFRLPPFRRLSVFASCKKSLVTAMYFKSKGPCEVLSSIGVLRRMWPLTCNISIYFFRIVGRMFFLNFIRKFKNLTVKSFQDCQ